MSEPGYAQLIRELFPRLTGGIRWGLERTTRLLAEAGNPHEAYPCIHIGGTNGKGSVAALMASALHQAGLRTGLYSSPHLCTFRERIRINGRPITEDALLAAARPLWSAIGREKPSFFEATTAIALYALSQAEVDVAVIEVGLGGRLDATNVITPVVSVLTNVSLDHVQLLGDSLEAVAREKAGILKPGVVAITAESESTPLAIFLEKAAELGAPLRVLRAGDVRAIRTGLKGTRFEVQLERSGWTPLGCALAGAHQATNAALAARALELLPEWLRPTLDAVRTGFAQVEWPGRLQIERAFGRTWVFDVAHNVAGVQALTAALAELKLPRPLIALVGVLGDKDWRTMLVPIDRVADAMVLTLPPTAPEDRTWDPDAVLREIVTSHTRVERDFQAALERVHALAAAGPGTILVTGSFHTVGDALIALGRAPAGFDMDLPPPAFAE